MALDKCKHPFYTEQGILVGCGKCLYCKIMKRNEWTGRLIMEKAVTQHTCFVTLTYADEHLPPNNSLSKTDLQKFFKRLRKKVSFRYYACGEYGDEFGRPHYHIIFFGLPKNDETDKLIREVWKFGLIQVDNADTNAIRYVAGYVTKKYSKEYFDSLKDGKREREFSLMSRKPALGTAYLEILKDYAFLQNPFDVLMIFSLGGRSFPISKVLRRKLQKMVMTDDEIEHIKSLHIQLMKEDVSEMVKEFAPLNFSKFIATEGVDDKYLRTWRREVVGSAYLDKNYEKVQTNERIFHRRHKRKDL